MGVVVVEGAIIQCSHGGKSKISSGSSKLTVKGKKVVVAGMEAGISFIGFSSPPTPDNPAACPVKTTSSPPSPSPCTATVAATSGLATTLTVGGIPALLDSASGQTMNAVSPGTWSISDAGQSLLKAR